MKRTHLTSLTATLLLCAAGGVASAQTTPPAKPEAAPAKAPAQPVKLTLTAVVIEAADGKVQYRANEQAEWTPAKAGTKLQQGVKFRLGFFSALRLRIGDSQLLTFDHAGTFVVTEAVNDGVTDITRIVLDQGRALFDVKRTRYANNVEIKTPDMTLSITGTSGGLEFTPGQPTRAFGDVKNNGRIELDYRTGAKQRVVMTRAEQSSAVAQDPAFNRALGASVETTAIAARDKDEVRVIKRAEGNSQSVPLDLGDLNTSGQRIDLTPMLPSTGPISLAAPSGATLHLDSTIGLLFQTDQFLNTSTLRQGIAINPAATEGGSAILTEPSTGFRYLVYAESQHINDSVKNVFSALPLESTFAGTKALGERSGPAASTPLVTGLGAIRDQLYASGRQGDGAGRDSIYRVDPSNVSLTEVMSPGVRLEGAIGGVSERGTLFAFGFDPGAAAGGTVLQRGVLLEMDPRNNYLVGAYSALDASLGASVATSNPSGVDLAGIQSITGLAADQNSVTLSAAVNQGTGRMALLRYDLHGTPSLAQVRLAPDGFTSGLASETTAMPPVPHELRAPSGPIDMVAQNARFAMMAYSPQAFNSGLVERVVRTDILQRAIDPGACGTSGALGALHGILVHHVDEQAGIGQSITEFRLRLPEGHPCLPAQ